eukprot:9574926-Alexandrium_andersonii.AAC.1
MDDGAPRGKASTQASRLSCLPTGRSRQRTRWHLYLRVSLLIEVQGVSPSSVAANSSTTMVQYARNVVLPCLNMF